MMTLETISKEESARYMGVKGVPDGRVKEMLDRLEPVVRERIRPKYVYRKTSVSFTEDGVYLGGLSTTLAGNDIKKHLSGCTEAVVLAVTLSAEADKLIRQTAVTDMAEALAVDCLCSAGVEQVCNNAEREIFSVIKAPYRTWRFSAGYGDFPLDIQKDLLLFLNAQRRIGLTVTENSLLIPSKSVTAIIGISETPIKRGKKGCESCRMKESCAFSASGKTCSEG
ncbi:MAG: 5-methyltetrahydrofolate--homocysteine methyltransferase [Ruminococcus flavefaciens]|nr:5-methyltetrahydrofolate--homocysteine methyltransferase [Ruminococcus flavefaciens]